MSDARALVAALARFAARRPRPPYRKIAIPAALAALAALAVGSSASATSDDESLPALPATELPATPESFTVRLTSNGAACAGFYAGGRSIVSSGHCVVETDIADAFTGPVVTRSVRTEWTAELDTGHKMKADLVMFGDNAFGGDDILVLRLRGALPDNWTPATLDCSGAEPKNGTRVFADGFPGVNNGPTYTEGYVNGRARVFPGSSWQRPVMYVTMPIAAGHSGAALRLQDTGAVVGILAGWSPSQPGWSYAQPIKPVCDALRP